MPAQLNLRPTSAVRPLRALLAASIIVPLVVLVGGAWLNWNAQVRQASRQIAREADVLHEHTSKVLETAELLIAEINQMLGDRSHDQLRADEKRLNAEMAAMIRELPQVRDVWVVDAAGKPIASALFYPVPPVDLADRDYHAGVREGGGHTFIGAIVTGRTSNTRYFNIAGRLGRSSDAYGGEVAVAVVPEYFSQVYATLLGDVPATAGLVRADGTLLARHPMLPSETFRFGPESSFMKVIARSPERGSYETVSAVDLSHRWIAYRKLAKFPIYVFAGRDRSAVTAEWLKTMSSHLVFGVPATLCLFAITLVALRRTERAEAEARRREAAEAALRHAQKMEAIGQLTGGVAHDINNLLMVVAGNLEILKEKVAGTGADRQLAAIERAARRGESLIRQLLAFSRRQALQPRVIEIANRLPKMIDLIRASLRGDVEIASDTGPDLPPIEVDPGEFELALLNIAVNARDAMPNGGTLRVAARAVTLDGRDAALDHLAGEFVALSLSDTGTGIPADVLPRVFEPFFTTKDVGKGTGLGLSQVYGFAKQSGGTAAVSSEPGLGTTVTLYLPRAAAAAPAVPEERSPGAAHAGTGAVLVVEDNDEVAEVTAALVERLGFVPQRARSARQALEMIEAGKSFRLVLTDIVMPGEMNGIDLARLLRERRPSLPLVLVTGYSDAAQQAAAEGFAIVTKPFRREALEQAIAARLAA